ncbi:S8 family serine peptidase [Clostridium sp. YIM B02505]|uniref:S8 family serine peptidase n=1 Tax=Clostridium yunnanense TaxID=2800325 RepID=A0ABS1EWW0_9CLOT|nr:S8 family serine peptidase [Clostridium yunnanense]MBK1813870.1 S8 family serine peptidase [Clostridium yunnanense]
MKNFKRHMSTVILYFFCMVTVLGNINVSVSAAEKSTRVPLETVNGQLVIKLRDTKNKDYENIIKKYNGKVIKYFSNYILTSFEKEDVTNVKTELATDKNVEYSEENALGKKSTTTTDPLAKTQDYLFYSRAMDAWDLVTDQMKQTTVKIAVVDSGVKSDHPDLKGSVDPGMNYVGGSTDTTDDNGHGTQVAGVIAAKHNNLGINGIAGLMDTRIIPVKVLDANGVGTTANIAQGIMYAANSGAQIINVSINGKGYSKLIDDAVQYAIGKGAIVVASSGDDGSYSENYWPCNANGTIVAASSNRSNTGKNIDVFALGEGNTTDIGSTGYKTVYGSSISAAITTGAVALIKAKNPTYTLDQVRNLLRKSNVSIGDNANLSLKSALESQSDFITITNPVISQNTTGDVAGKITALNPSQLKQLSLFINDNATAYKVIQGNGSKTYDTSIPFTELVDGVNKLKAVATDSTGKTYVDERYFKSFGDDSTINITVKDLNGNLAKNMLVLLYEGNGANNPKEVSTNSNGQAIFYNANKYSQYTAVVRNGDADSSSKLIFVKQGVTIGKSIIDLAKESKEITINAYKADNTTMLSAANLSLDDLGDIDIALNKGASTKIIVNKSVGLNMKVLSEEEGYYYKKAVGSFESLSTVNFLKDSNTAKLEVNNIYDQQITDESIIISSKDGVYNGYPLATFNIKGKALYLPKGSYSYTYSFSSNTSGSTSDYQPEDINLSGDSTITYGEPKVNVEQGIGNFNLCMNLTDVNHSFVLQDVDNSKIIINLKDPNGKSLVNGVDFTYTNAPYYKGEGFSIKLNSPISGNYQASITVNYMGKTFTSNVISLSFTGVQQSTNTTIKYTLPTELQSLVASQGYYTLDVRYYVYNASTGAMVYNQGELEDTSSINYGEISIPTTYCNNSYRIIISASAEYDKGVIYDRSLGTALNGVIKIDPATYTKKISFNGNSIDQYIKNSNVRITKIMSNNKNINIQMKVSNSSNLGVWVDDGKYSSIFSTSKSLIRSEFNVSESNSIANIDTTNLSNIKFTVPQNSYAKGIYIYPKIVNGELTERFEVDYSGNYQITAGTIINSFELSIADITSLRNKSYYFSGQLQCNALAQNNIDISKCNVQYANTPLSVNKNDSLNFNSKVTAGAFTLSSFYSSHSWKGMNDSFNYYTDDGIGLNIYNSENKFLMWNSFYMSGYDVSNGFNANAYLSNLYGGDFKIKLDLEGLNLIDNGFSIKVVGDDIKIKVMDPFDITKPLSNGTVSLDGYGNGNDYKTSKDGYVYIPKSNLQNNSNVIVKAEGDKGIAVFRSSVNISGSEATISTPTTLLKNIIVKPLDSDNGINLASAELRVNTKGYNNYKLGLLNAFGQANLYTNFDISKVFVQNGTSFLNTTYSGQGDVVIDNKNIGKLNVSLLSNKYLNITVDNSSNFSIQASGSYNLSAGSYGYNYNNSNINYSGSLNISAGETKELKFGSTLSLSADYYSNDGTTSSNVIKPGQNIGINVRFKDEFGNFVYPSQQTSFTYVVAINGIEARRGSVTGSGYVLINPNIIADSFDVSFETTYNNQRYASNTLNYKINLDNYQKIAVRDPEGNPINEGKFGNSNYQLNGTIINNGNAYIDKNLLQSGAYNVSLSGISSSGHSVIYRDLTLNSNTVEIKDSSANKVPVTANVPLNSGNITLNLLTQTGANTYSEYYSVEQFNKLYKNNYLWITSADYVINVNASVYNNSINENYSLADTISGTKAVNLDYTKTTKINLSNPNNYSGSYNFKVGNIYMNSQLSSNNSVNKISSNIFDGYTVSLYNGSSSSMAYRKELSTPISGDSYTIYVGGDYLVKADNTDFSTITPSKSPKAKVYLLDQYDNYVLINNTNNLSVGIEISNNGQVIENINQNIYVYNQPYEITFTPSVSTSFNAVFKLNILGKTYSSNAIAYTIDASNYKTINVNDPNGKPLKTGEAKQYGNTYNISQGIMYVPKDTILNGTISISGTTDNGDYVVCPQVTVSGTVTNIDLQGKKVNVITTFDNISDIVNGRLNITWNNSYFGGAININYNTDKGLVSNLNVWLQDNVECYFDNYFYDKSNNQYALGGRFKNISSSIQLSTNNMTEIKLGGIDNKNANIMISQINNGGGTGFSVKYSKIFVSSNTYYVNGVSLYDNTSTTNYNLKNTDCVNGTSYTIFIGKNYTGNFSTDKLLKTGENMIINGGIVDEYGNNVSSYSGGNKEVQFVNVAGTVVKTIKSQNGSVLTVPTDIIEGKYSLVISNYIGDKKIASGTVDNVYITNKSVLALGYYGNKPLYKLYDGTTLIYSGGSQVNSVKIPSSVLTDGKYYDLDILTQNYDGIGHYKRRYLFSNGQMQNDSVVNSVSIPLDSSVKKVSLTTSKGDTIDYNTQDNYYNNTSAINLSLADGETYNISAYCEDSNGGYWASKTVKVDTTLKEIKFDRLAAKKLSLASKFVSNVEVVGLKAKDLFSGKVYDINRGLNTKSSIYLPVGKYEVNFKLNLNGTTTLNDYKKTVDLTSTDYTLNIGDKVTYDVVLDKNVYSPYDKVTARLSNVNDGEIALTGIENAVIDSSSITMNLVHGTKVLKSFNSTIPSSLKGDCNFVVKGSTVGLGDITSKALSINVNNPSAIKEGDINLDGIVDIFDIVYVARDFGKMQGQGDYDPRVNLDASDTTIDVKDLARAAVNYEK